MSSYSLPGQLPRSVVGEAPYWHWVRDGPGLAGRVPSSSPQHCMIWTKSVLNSVPARVVGAPPVQETVIAWLVRCLVWLTVNLMSLNSPRPETVTAESVV
ncbi:hypothetical protein [Streptomyces mirabilis]|uniref:hypothetical protein n=1 Tax=Streptomyces mirabilis TaxID=68239 RepID=UPI0033F479DD